MLDQLNRLYYHAGFPNEQQLMCHVFTQNKGAYINKLNKGSLSNEKSQKLTAGQDFERRSFFWAGVSVRNQILAKNFFSEQYVRNSVDTHSTANQAMM